MVCWYPMLPCVGKGTGPGGGSEAPWAALSPTPSAPRRAEANAAQDS